MSWEEIIIRISITFGAALIFGVERQFSNKPIGFGTYIFVAIGSCGLAIGALTIYDQNPMPLLSGIVTGIGFLGAGALIKTSDKIFGFTSAASIWLFAIIGLSIGIGGYLTASVLYVLVWLIIGIDRFFEIFGLGLYQKKVTLVLNKKYTKSQIKALIGARKYKTLKIHFDKLQDVYSFTLIVENKKSGIDYLPELLADHEDIIEFIID